MSQMKIEPMGDKPFVPVRITIEVTNINQLAELAAAFNASNSTKGDNLPSCLRDLGYSYRRFEEGYDMLLWDLIEKAFDINGLP